MKEWIQNGESQNGEITKQRLLQNDDCYKTAKIIQKNFNKKSTVLRSA